jgi:predicted RNA binding protein YcfA (HicA-like mRNA interferase family)
MTKLPAFTAREVIKKLKKAGFAFDRQAKGSHEIWYDPTTKRRTTIPNHPGVDIPKGTLSAIIKEAGLTEDEFLAL